MLISYYIMLVSALSWILTPLRQYKNRFYYLFLVFGMGDPLFIFYIYLTHWRLYMYWPFYYVAYYATVLYAKGTLTKKKIIPALIIMFIVVFLGKKTGEYFNFCVNSVILYELVVLLAEDVFKKSSIRIFYLLLFVYQLSMVLKLFMRTILEVPGGALFGYIILGFQVLIACYFIIFSLENGHSIRLIKKSVLES